MRLGLELELDIFDAGGWPGGLVVRGAMAASVVRVEGLKGLR